MSRLSVQAELETVSSDVQKQVQLPSLLSMNKYIIICGKLRSVNTTNFNNNKTK
jgi:hypothetical protein